MPEVDRINVKKSVIIFFSLFISLYSVSFLIDGFITDKLIDQGQEYFDENINSDKFFDRRVRILKAIDDDNSLVAQIIYLRKQNPDGTFRAKTIETNIRREGLISIILFISMVFAFPVNIKRNSLKFIIGTALLILFMYFKLYVFVFDNYNDPESALKQLEQPISGIVYYSTYFFNVTGAGSVVIIPVILWFVLNIFDFSNIINSTKN